MAMRSALRRAGSRLCPSCVNSLRWLPSGTTTTSSMSLRAPKIRSRFFSYHPPKPSASPTTPPASSSASTATRMRGAGAGAGRRPPHIPDYAAYYGPRNASTLWYSLSIIVGVTGISYAAVPFYRAICQRTGFGGTPITDSTRFTKDKLHPVHNAPRLRVTFNGSVSDVLQWKFTPQQRDVRVLPGETALAFFTATNKSEEDIIGVATYSVTPAQVAPYFSKIQCFCFEEQKLLAGETVDMPVFFFIDPEFVRDPQMKGIETVTLSYTFFKARYDKHGNLTPVPVVHSM